MRLLDGGTTVAPVHCTRTLEPRAASAGAARALVRATLEWADRTQWVERAELAVSEIVTNALVHAGTPIGVRVSLGPRHVRVEVADGSPHLPSPRDYSPTSGTGRGLYLVADLVDRWGSRRDGGGKIVWFEIGSGETSPEEGASSSARDEKAKPAAFVAVELFNFPVLLHAAWQEHASALLREYLLTQEDEAVAFARHAQASTAMNLLHEQAPAPELGDDPAAIMATAIEPRVSAPILLLTVPRDSLPCFATLDAMLDEAIELAATGALLVPPTQPEIADMRRWVCEQVRTQGLAVPPSAPGGGPRAAVSWSTQHGRDGVAPADVPQDTDPHGVSTSNRDLVAITEAGVIFAVSPSALRRLGYADVSELVGRRIIAIVPPRYHQAHIAGITLHLTNGRAPLLGVRITVPVVRADGSEELVGLLVEPQLLSSGDRTFVAEFFSPS